jgi:sphingosine kinase
MKRMKSDHTNDAEAIPIMITPPILEQIFSYGQSPQKSGQLTARLFENRIDLAYESDISEQTVYMNDLVGTQCERTYRHDDLTCSLIIHAFPYENACSSSSNNGGELKKIKRQRSHYKLDCCKPGNSLEQNFELVSHWHNTIKSLQNKQVDPSFQVTSVEDPPRTHLKPFLVFVNPRSGTGKATKMLLNNVFNIWNEAGLTNHIIFTEYLGHAKDCVRKLDLGRYRGIVVISGDGILYEVLNGLFEREDWETAIKIPLGQIPGGSANALSSCVAYTSNEQFNNLTLEEFSSVAAFSLARLYKPQPLDLISLQLSNGKFVHSLLNLEWSIVADVDAESEQYRFMGEARFVIGCLIRIMSNLYA